MSTTNQKILQYLNEAHATEMGLVRVLQSQIAMTPRGSYRTGLEKHLGETRQHAERLQNRIRELGEGGGLTQAAIGLAENVAAQALALSKTPLDLIRGTGGEEKVLKNAKDAASTEALEIATYTSIEQFAKSVGDEETARLAASIRADEERMLDRILKEIPKLTDAVMRAELKGDSSYSARKTGAADAGRTAARRTRSAAKRTSARASTRGTQSAKSAGARATQSAKSAGARATQSGKTAGVGATQSARTAGASATQSARTAGASATQSAKTARAKAERTASRAPGGSRATGAAKGAVATQGDLPIARYDSLNADEIVRKLPELSQQDLGKVEGYERKKGSRATVLDRISSLRGNEPWPGYDQMNVDELRKAISDADESRARKAREYERSHKNRAGVIEATERELQNA